MIQRALHRGNPRLYSTYRDESLNGIIAKIARSAHRRTWSNVIHFKRNIFHQKNLEAYLARDKGGLDSEAPEQKAVSQLHRSPSPLKTP